MRRAAAVDANQSEIVAALRKAGASVQPLHTVGQGCPDLLIGYRGQNILAEVKDGSKPPSERGLTDAQLRFSMLWRGQFTVINSVTEALDLIGVAG